MVELDYLNVVFQLPQSNIFTFPVGLAVGAIFGALIANEIVYARKTKEERIKLYSRLYGEKFTIVQFFVSVASTAITIANNDALKRYLIENRDKNDAEAKNIIEKIDTNDSNLRNDHDKGIIDLAKKRERLSKDIGLTKILFKSQQIDGLINIIENSENAIWKFIEDLDMEIIKGEFYIEFEFMPTPQSLTRVKCVWQTKKEEELKILDTALQHAIDNLLAEIKGML
jgi:hypothetical protein